MIAIYSIVDNILRTIGYQENNCMSLDFLQKSGKRLRGKGKRDLQPFSFNLYPFG